MLFMLSGIKYRVCSKVCKGKVVHNPEKFNAAKGLCSLLRRECVVCGEYTSSGMIRYDRKEPVYVPQVQAA